MNADVCFMVVEDRDADRAEVLNQLADMGFMRDHLLAEPGTYERAMEALEQHAARTDVVFLDLNIPRTEADTHADRGHGRGLLEYIHKTLNKRLGVDIKVIIVSGEDLLDGWNDRNLHELFPGTLVGICQKTCLEPHLKANLKRLRRDPLLSRAKKAGVDIVDDYRSVVEPANRIESRLESARRIAIFLLRNEVDHYNGRVDSCREFADDLHGLIRHHVEPRFGTDREGRSKVKLSLIKSPGGWGAFLWRGAMIQHLYAINSYRNTFAHMNEQPYRAGEDQVWQLDQTATSQCERGETVGTITAFMIKELLEWYLPWHEQVYRPWLEGLRN